MRQIKLASRKTTEFLLIRFGVVHPLVIRNTFKLRDCVKIQIKERLSSKEEGKEGKKNMRKLNSNARKNDRVL